ncbi:hypothetical protein [Tateyamaria pelophila]|uniref:hypothetical protein n=1 Tax=Tateyamaria pelophila TaxID=328415 RepID=UPI001CC10ED6|nr:hypothetical protein [Tateyamaria pelophila]
MGTEGSLDAAMGLAAPGRTHSRQRLRMVRRDAALRALWRAWRADLGPTAAADLIAQHWRRYATSGWPRHWNAGTEPAAEPEATLHRLMVKGQQPLSANRLRKILGENGHFPPMELTSPTDDL